MPVPTTPHLAWGGTTCPGARWREWVPQLRALAIEEGDDMTEEQWKLLQDTHHHVHVLIPGLFVQLERNNRSRYDQLRKDIAAISTGGGATCHGTTPAQSLAMSKKALKEGSG